MVSNGLRGIMNILSYEEVIKVGIEFSGDVCYSGEYGQQVCTNETDKGGIPVEGILYELYPNGNLNYYACYKNGVSHGERIRFYESGAIKSYCIMDSGTIDGDNTEWYESGSVKCKEFCKHGLVLWRKEFDIEGNLISEKKELTEQEKPIYEKREKHYEKSRTN